MNDFLKKYKVLLTGLLGAVILAVVNIDASNGIEWGDMIMPVVIGTTSFIANQLRGQWSSIFGIVIAVVIGFIQAKVNHQPYTFTPQQLQFLLAQVAAIYFGYNAPPFKDRSYEHDAQIVQAKENPNVVPLKSN